MKIAILDYDNNRVIVGEVPQYVIEGHEGNPEGIAEAVTSALGLSVNNTYHMVGDFDVQIDVSSLNGGHGYNHNVNQGIEQLTQNFKQDALQALKDNAD